MLKRITKPNEPISQNPRAHLGNLARTASTAAWGLSLMLTGCAIAPNTVRVQGQHISHLGQHFDGSGNHYGAELVNVTARWNFGHWFAEWGESLNLAQDTKRDWIDYCRGGICGSREVTTVSAGYEFRIKP